MTLRAEQVDTQMLIEAIEAAAIKVLEGGWCRTDDNDQALVAGLIACEAAEWLSGAGWIVVGGFQRVERSRLDAGDAQGALALA